MTGLLLVFMSWLPVTTTCHDTPLLSPIASYEVKTWIGAMKMDASCPLDDDGNAQACAIWTAFPMSTSATSLFIPDPALGEVLVYIDPVAITQSGARSDGPCPAP